MNKKSRRALIAAGVLSIGLASCKAATADGFNKDNNPSTAIESVYNNENNLDYLVYNTTQINEEEFKEFDHTQFYTLLEGTQVYDFALNSLNLSPDYVNGKNIMVKGISTNGDITLIELADGQRKYVSSYVLVEPLVFERNQVNNCIEYEKTNNDDYTVNTTSLVYNRDGICVGFLEEGTRCLDIATSGDYVFVITENDEYFFIHKDNISLTKKYHKGLFAPKKLEKSNEQLSPYIMNQSSWVQNRNQDVVWDVVFDNDVFVENTEQPYRTLFDKQLVYFRNGNITPTYFSDNGLVKVLSESENNAYVEFCDGSRGYVAKRALGNALVLDRNSFAPILRNRNQLTKDWDWLYDTNGVGQYPVYPGTEVLALETNGEYTLVEFQDGSRGYITSNNLIEAEYQISRYVYLKPGTDYYYEKDGQIIKLNSEEHTSGAITYLFYIDGEYAYIGDYYCRENYLVKVSDIDMNYNIEEVQKFGYVQRDTSMNSEINGTGTTSNVDDYDLYWVYYNCGEYSYVYNEHTRECGYIKTSELTTFTGCFYFVDLDAQRVYYYDDHNGQFYYMTHEWPIRSGNDSNPSHEGAFDIDWKAKEWEFTTYRGSYAHYWIPYNEYGEGFHDLIGDDEQNYGNEAYHIYGSHGCIRVPVEASEFIYNTSPVGTIVLVNRK